MTIEHGFTEHRDRSLAEHVADVSRLRRMHVHLTHGGDADACRCELVAVDADEDVVTAELLEDVDGNPAGVGSRRRPVTGATWRIPQEGEPTDD